MLTEVAETGRLDSATARGARAEEFATALAPVAGARETRVTWVGVNRQRVDATVESPDGTWRVVFGTSDGVLVDWLSVFTRRPYPTTVRGLVLVLNGPSGAGKSRLMEAVAEQSEVPWVRFDEPILGTVDHEFLIWRESADTLHRGYLAGIAALAAEGNRVVTSAAGLPQSWFQLALGSIPALYVGLDCPLDVLLGREDGREGRWGGLAESSVGVHEGWSYDLLLESDRHNPSALARLLLRELPEVRQRASAASTAAASTLSR